MLLQPEPSHTLEQEAADLPADDASKHRAESEDIQQARLAVLWWLPAGKKVCQQSLATTDFSETESTDLMRRPILMCAEMQRKGGAADISAEGAGEKQCTPQRYHNL